MLAASAFDYMHELQPSKNDLVLTKKDLDLAIEEVRKEIVVLRYDTLKFIVWTGIGVVIAIGGMMASLVGMIAKGFHWF
jgi:hypothetical protein